jgi:Glycosyl transferase family 2
MSQTPSRPDAAPISRSAPVSVAMAVYNGMAFLPEQMQSVLAELRPDDQLVVIDDHSSDGSWAWLQALDDPRVTVTRNDRNLGVRLSFEKALSACRHGVIFLCDQDDLWLPGKRAAFTQAFEADADCTVVVSDARVIDPQGKIVAESFMALRGGFKGSVPATLVKNRYLGCCMAVRSDVIALGLPIPDLAPMHDMWFGAVAASVGHVHFIDQPYLHYRRHGGNVTPSRHAGLGQMLRWRWALWRALRSRLGKRRDAAPQA